MSYSECKMKDKKALKLAIRTLKHDAADIIKCNTHMYCGKKVFKYSPEIERMLNVKAETTRYLMIASGMKHVKGKKKNDIKDELRGAKYKLHQYIQLKDSRLLQAAADEAKHAMMYMEIKGDMRQKDWYDKIMADIQDEKMKLAKPTA